MIVSTAICCWLLYPFDYEGVKYKNIYKNKYIYLYAIRIIFTYISYVLYIGHIYIYIYIYIGDASLQGLEI